MALLLTFTSTETGTDTGTDTGTSTTDTGTSTDEGLDCGGASMCSSGTPPTITLPHDGDEVVSPFLLHGTPGQVCYCDTCGCFLTDDYYAQVVEVDGEEFASGDLPLEISLPVGTYQLSLRSHNELLSNPESASITVTVTASEAGTTAGATETGDEASDTPANEGASKGCGCSADEQGNAPLGTLLLGLLGLGLARRRE